MEVAFNGQAGIARSSAACTRARSGVGVEPTQTLSPDIGEALAGRRMDMRRLQVRTLGTAGHSDSFAEEVISIPFRESASKPPVL